MDRQTHTGEGCPAGVVCVCVCVCLVLGSHVSCRSANRLFCFRHVTNELLSSRGVRAAGAGRGARASAADSRRLSLVNIIDTYE